MKKIFKNKLLLIGGSLVLLCACQPDKKSESKPDKCCSSAVEEKNVQAIPVQENVEQPTAVNTVDNQSLAAPQATPSPEVVIAPAKEEVKNISEQKEVQVENTTEVPAQ
jgi:hypothetical protein